jgi:hypothetical protein
MAANCPESALPDGVPKYKVYDPQWELPPSYYQYQVGRGLKP